MVERMTREEVKKILAIIATTYTNFKPESKTEAIEAWYFFLEEYSYQEMSLALKAYVKASGSDFPPTPSSLIKYVNNISDAKTEQISELEAWARVNKALRNSTYNAEEEFSKLPVLVQKALGTSATLRSMAVDEEYNEGVARSNFLRSYNNVVSREKEIAKYPKEVIQEIASSNEQYRALVDKVINAICIENKH